VQKVQPQGGMPVTSACSVVSKLCLTAALLVLALAGHIVLAQNGEVFASLMQNFLAQALDHSYDSERSGCVTSSAQVATASHNLPPSQGHPSLPGRTSPEVTQ
jgi:hypothetical protein